MKPIIRSCLFFSTFAAARIALIAVVFTLEVSVVRGQDPFNYDQQSATNGTGHMGYLIQAMYPMGQSFTPTLPSVDFVQFQLSDAWRPGDGLGATMYVNLRSGSITGAVLASSAPVVMPDGFIDGVTNFIFSAPVPLIPGTTYYMEPVLQTTNEPWYIKADYYYYPGGAALLHGNRIDLDLWFREGVVVPEPTPVVHLLLGVVAFWFCRAMSNKSVQRI